MREKKSAFVLVAHLDEEKIFRFLLSPFGVYSFAFQYDHRFSLPGQLESFLKESLGLKKEELSRVDLYRGFRERLLGEEDFLYFALVKGPLQLNHDLRSFSFRESLAVFPQKENRLILLKSFQLLSDDKTHLIEAREVSPGDLTQGHSLV